MLETRLPLRPKTPGRSSDSLWSAAALRQKPGSACYATRKNALGMPEYKLARSIWTVEKGRDDTRYYLRREYGGSGKHNPFDIASTPADRVQIACENAR